MVQEQNQHDEKIKADKFKEHMHRFGNNLNRILKEEFDPILENNIDLAIEVYQKNLNAFSKKGILLPSFGEAKKYGFSFDFKKANVDEKQIYDEAVKEFKKRADDSLNKYIHYLICNSDFAAYLKILRSCGYGNDRPQKLIEYCKKNLSVNLCDKNITRILSYCLECRNKISHGDDVNTDELTNDELKKKYLNAYKELAYLFLKKDDQKYLADINDDYERGIEIIESVPIDGNEIIRRYSEKFNDDNSIRKCFGIDYNLETRKLYSYTEKAFIERAMMFANISNDANAKVDDSSAIVVKNNTKVNIIKSLLEYNKVLTTYQMVEIGKECPIFIDDSVFEGKNIEDGKVTRSFINKFVLEPLESIKVPALINHSSRIKMNVDFYRGETEEIRICAKNARDKIGYFIERGCLNFTKNTGAIYEKGIYETIDLAKNNPSQRFFVIVGNDADAKLLDKKASNCLVAKVFRFRSDRKLVLTQESINKLKDFATGRGYGVIDEVEVQEVLKSQEPVKNERKTMIEKKEEEKEIKSKTVAQKTNINKQVLPKLGTVKCIPETGVLLTYNKKIQEGYALKTDAQKIIKLGKSLGQGAEGTVYEIDNNTVAKIYNKEHLTKNRYDKLKLMVDSNVKIRKVCWPISLIFDEKNNFAGYIMPKASGRYLELGESILALNNPRALRDVPHLKEWDRLKLVRFCYHLAITFMNIHQNNLLVGDINQGNIMVNLSDKDGGDFLIVDTDSFQVGPYPSPVGTPVFTSPEIYKRTNQKNPRYGEFLRTLEDEQYALASMLFQILMLGTEPFAGKGVEGEGLDALQEYNFDFRGETSTGVDTPDGPYRMIWANMDPQVKKMFEQVFTGGKTISAQDWANVLKTYAWKIENGKSTRELEPYRYPKADYIQEFTCPICEREANLPKNKYDREVKYGIPVCTECNWKIVPSLKKAMVSNKCSKCGRTYTLSRYDALTIQINHKEEICPDCNTVINVECKECGNNVKVKKYWTYDNQNGFRCASCKEELETTCTRCGKSFGAPRFYIRKYTGRILCDECKKQLGIIR